MSQIYVCIIFLITFQRMSSRQSSELAPYRQRNYTFYLSNLGEIWRKKMFSDVTLALDDREIRAHRVILSMFSPYFFAMFSHDTKEASGEHRVELGNMDGGILEKVIGFGYTGEIDITENNVFDIMSIANYFAMDPLISGCCEFLLKRMSVSNCLDILISADCNGCQDLYKASQTYVLHHFVETCDSEKFLGLKPDLVTKLFENEDIRIENRAVVIPPAEIELTIWNVVQKYVEFDLPNRQHLLPAFLGCIRLHLLDCRLIKQSALIEGNDECRRILNRAGKANMFDMTKLQMIPGRFPREFLEIDNEFNRQECQNMQFTNTVM